MRSAARSRSALEAAGVNITAVRVLAGVPSGLALITVDATGENSITVAPGANGQAGPAEAAAAAAAAGDALVLSAEIPVPVLAAALDRARGGHVLTVLNLAPAPPDASGLLEAGVDWLVVNAPEAAAILGRPVADPAAAQAAAADLAGAGAGHVVITLGPDGAVLAARATGRHRHRAGRARVQRAQRGQRRGGRCLRRRAGRGGGVGSDATRGGPARLRGRRHGRDQARRSGGAAHRGRRAGRHGRAMAAWLDQVSQENSAEARGANSAGLSAKRWCAVASRRVAQRGSSRTVFREGR